MRKYLVASLSVFLLCFTSTRAQIPTAKSARAIPFEVEVSENRVSQIIARAEEHFTQGTHKLKLNQREKARQDFDRAVDTILESGYDVRAHLRLQTFYLELVERIYREEVPLGTQRHDRSEKPGFRDQMFAANPLDELSKPILRSGTKSTRPTSSPNSLAVLKGEHLSSVKQYKAGLEKVLGLYEQSLRQAEERFAKAKHLYANGLVRESGLVDAARSVSGERERVASTRKLIADADNQIRLASLENNERTSRLSSVVGPRPPQLANGQVPAVIRYLNDSLNDPYSMKLLNWSKLSIVYRRDQPFWYVTLRLRAKNGFGAYILREAGFYLRNNKVVFTDNL